MEPPVVQKDQPTVEDSKVSTNGPSAPTSTEKEDSRGDKSAAASEQTVEPDATPSDSKTVAAKSPPVSPVKNTKDGHSDERDKEQSGTNDTSSRAIESVRYSSYMNYTADRPTMKTETCFLPPYHQFHTQKV